MAGTSYKGSEIKDVNQFIKDAKGLSSSREKEIGQHIGYRYDVNLIPDYSRITPFLMTPLPAAITGDPACISRCAKRSTSAMSGAGDTVGMRRYGGSTAFSSCRMYSL